MRLLALLAAAPLLGAAPLAAQEVARATAPAAATMPAADPDTVAVQEWTVPWERSRPRDPYFDATTGDVWFVGQVGNYVARLNPTSGEFKRYEIGEGDYPHNLIVDGDGTVWYAGNRSGTIGKLDPATGKVTHIAMPDTAARDPHTLIFGRENDIWFTVQGGSYVGRLDKASGQVRLVKVEGQRQRPYGIDLDPQGRAWFNISGTNQLGMIDPQTMELKRYTLPHASTTSRRIAVLGDGSVWYPDEPRGFLGRLDPATGEVKEWAMPGAERSRPYALLKDDADRVWFVEAGMAPNRLVGFDPRTERFFSVTPIRSSVDGNGRNTVRHMMYHAPTRALWFGTDANTIGRATLPPR